MTDPIPPVVPVTVTEAPDPADVYAERPQRPGGPKRRRALVIAGVALLTAVVAVSAWALLRKDPAAPVTTITRSPHADEMAPVAADGPLAQFDTNGDGIVYQDGMHPQIVQDEPGLCPICNMELTPVQVSGGEAGVVEIDPVTLQNMGVRTAVVASRGIERDLRTTGTFEARDTGRETVTLRVGGFVQRLFVDTEGQRVRQGQPLLEIYSPELVSTQQDLLLATRNRELLGGGAGSERLVEAARTRLRLFGLGAQQIAAVERSGSVQETVTIFAPASGTVQNKRVVDGMQATPGMPLMDIVNLGAVYLQVAVPEQDLGWVKPGVRAVVAVAALPGEEIRGRVGFVYDTVDPATRTGTARVTLANAGGRLRPGMTATATLYGAPTAAGPVVPSEAVVRTGAEAPGEAVVIVALGEGRFRPVQVRVGEEAGGVTRVLSGLSVGDHVVTSAQFLIDSEARLSSAIAGMTGGGSMPGMDMGAGTSTTP